MNKKNCVEIGQIKCSLVWVSKDNSKIYRYDTEKKRMYKGSFEIYSKKYLRYFVNYWDKFPMFHDKLINAIDNEGNTSLIWATRDNNTELAKFLIEKGADINVKNNDGFRALTWATALMWISCNKNIDIAKLLIKKDANINAKDKYGDTALTCSYIKNNTELANFLIEKGAKE